MHTAIAFHQSWKNSVTFDHTVPFDFCSAHSKQQEIYWLAEIS
jgi:hypothetical protein